MKLTCLGSSCLLVFLLLCLCICLGVLGLGWVANSPQVDTSFYWEFPTFSDVFPTPEPSFTRPEVDHIPVEVPNTTLKWIDNTSVAYADLRELAEMMAGKQGIPVTVPVEQVFSVGDRKTFWISDNDTNNSFQVQAVLHYTGEVLNFWVQTGLDVDEDELVTLAETFERDIYPVVRAVFGNEWQPGVDEDPHLYILYTRGLGTGIAGYYSSVDEYHPDAHAYSNAHEIFYLNPDTVGLDEDFTYGVLAHEFQHMIQWHQDRNEETWLNEGLAELAAFTAGYDPGNFDRTYARNPDIPLTAWPSGDQDSSAWYGGSFLFMSYVQGRYGQDFIRQLAAHPANGLAGIDELLSNEPPDPLRSSKTSSPGSSEGAAPLPRADELFQDFTLALVLDDPSLDDGRYGNTVYSHVPQIREAETIRNCSQDTLERTVYQYGVDVIRITCPGRNRLLFEGSTAAYVAPVNPLPALNSIGPGKYLFWSNRVNESFTTLTHTFDFREHAGPLTLQYWAWYDLEEEFDYVYLMIAPVDQDAGGGVTQPGQWKLLKTPSGTTANSNGNNYGWGYTGLSNGWIDESVDLSEYAGQVVQIRFAYVTDAGVVHQGFLLDNLRIPELGYQEDFEQGEGGWIADGFVRIDNVLPQRFLLSVIKGEHVQYVALPYYNQVEINISNPLWAGETLLVVSGATRYTLQPATYRLSFLP